jgi:hypothetical protein
MNHSVHCVHACGTRSIDSTGFFYAITKRKRKEVAMKMLMVIMLVRAVIAYIETATNKNKKNIRNDADASKVQHPAETMMR